MDPEQEAAHLGLVYSLKLAKQLMTTIENVPGLPSEHMHGVAMTTAVMVCRLAAELVDPSDPSRTMAMLAEIIRNAPTIVVDAQEIK